MSTKMKFNAHYREHTHLQNKIHILFRLVRPNDKQHMVKAFDQLSLNSRYKRFFGTKKQLTQKELQYFTEIDQYNHFALAALELDELGNERGGIGVARFIRLSEDKECAEVGITVIDSAQGTGIGRLLLDRLFTAASERGIKRLRFEFLADNEDMKRLVKKLNDDVKLEHDHELLIAEIVIPKPCPETNQYPLDVIEELSLLIRKFSAEAFILYTNFSVGLFKRALDNATKYSLKSDNTTVKPSTDEGR